MAPNDPLQRGRAAFGREAWADACTHLTAADRQQPLEPGDLDRLATAAYLVGDDRASADARARAHAAHLERGDMAAAARSAFWLAFVAIDKPDQQAAASGWLARVRRLLDQCPAGCAERGFWLCAAGFQKLTGGDIAGARAAFEEAARIGAACRDADLTALARQSEGRILLRLRPGRRGPRDARRSDGVGDLRRGRTHDRRARVLQRDRGVPRSVRSEKGPGVDRRVGGLVRIASRHGAVPRHVPRSTVRAAPGARSLAGIDR